MSKVTREQIESRIVDQQFMVLPNTTVTICNLTLDNGYSVRGESACVDKRVFNMATGESLAYDDAIRKLWPLFGFLLTEQIFQGARRA